MKLALGQGHNESPGRWTKVQREQVNSCLLDGSFAAMQQTLFSPPIPPRGEQRLCTVEREAISRCIGENNQLIV